MLAPMNAHDSFASKIMAGDKAACRQLAADIKATSKAEAARKWGIGRRTIFRWIDEVPELQRALEKAK